MSGPNADQMRKTVSDMYAGPNWKTKVRRMPDGQVFAIFKREEQKIEEAKAVARAEKRREAKGVVPPPKDDIPF